MKKLADLQHGEKIYLYQLVSFPDREVFKKSRATVKITRTIVTHYPVAITNDNIRQQLRGDEGVVFRNCLWLTKEDDDYAKRIFRATYEKKINSFRNNIELYEKRIDMINNYFGEN